MAFSREKIAGAKAMLNEEGTGLKDGLKLRNVNEKRDMEIKFVQRENISKNENNFYRIDDIDSLKQSIEDLGLKQPLEVKRVGIDQYVLLSGERRLTAIDELIAEGKWHKQIPCVVTDFREIMLPLSDKDKEIYSIITTNKEVRKRTDGELMKEFTYLRDIYKKLKREGVETMLGVNGEVQIQGRFERDVMTEVVGASSGTIGAMTKVQNRGSESLIGSLMEGEVSTKAAAEIASLPKEEQDEVIETLKEEREKTGSTTSTKTDAKRIISSRKESTRFTYEEWEDLTEPLRSLLAKDVYLDDISKDTISKYIDLIKTTILRNVRG